MKNLLIAILSIVLVSCTELHQVLISNDAGWYHVGEPGGGQFKDFRLMKTLNVNSIRTCHYPDDPLFYDLADKWGFYICNEVNAECHYGQNYLAWQPGWEKAFMDRTERYLQRDKNILV